MVSPIFSVPTNLCHCTEEDESVCARVKERDR